MKKIYLTAMLIAVVSGIGILRAQTNTTAAMPAPRAPTLINSDRADFDLTARRAFYYGHVRVDDPQMKMTSEKMVADLPPSSGHISHIVAETNVVMNFLDDKGQTNHAISDKAVYDYNVQGIVTNETVTLTGHASVTNADGSWMTGEPIIWDRANNSVHASNEVMSIKQNMSDAMGITNSPTVKTNKPAPKIF